METPAAWRRASLIGLHSDHHGPPPPPKPVQPVQPAKPVQTVQHPLLRYSAHKRRLVCSTPSSLNSLPFVTLEVVCLLCRKPSIDTLLGAVCSSCQAYQACLRSRGLRVLRYPKNQAASGRGCKYKRTRWCRLHCSGRRRRAHCMCSGAVFCFGMRREHHISQ